MSFQEPRSFEPRQLPVPAERRAVKTRRVDEKRTTLQGLARGHNDLHDCLDDTRDTVDRITTLIGEPTDRPSHNPDDDSLFARMKRLEHRSRQAAIWWDRGKTAAFVLAPTISAFAALLWWLEGAKIARALGIGP